MFAEKNMFIRYYANISRNILITYTDFIALIVNTIISNYY